MRIPTPLTVRGKEFSLTVSSSPVGQVHVIYIKRLSGAVYNLRSTGQIARYLLSMCEPGSAWLLPGEDDTILCCMSQSVLQEIDMQHVGVKLTFGQAVDISYAIRGYMTAFTISCGLLSYGWMHIGSGFDTLVSTDALLPLNGQDVYRDVEAVTIRSDGTDEDQMCLKVSPSIYRVYPLRDSCVIDRASVVSLPRLFKATIRCTDLAIPSTLRDAEGLMKYWSIVHGIRLTREHNLEAVNVSLGKICLAYPQCCMWSDTWVRLPSTSITQAETIFTKVESDFKALESSLNEKHEIKRKDVSNGKGNAKRVKRA